MPVTVLVLVTGHKVLPEYRSDEAGRLDPTSVALSLAALLPIVYGVKELARDGWATLPVIALVVGLTSGAVFLRRQTKLREPLLDLGLFRHPAIGTSLGGQLAYSMVGAGFMFFMMLYLQLVVGMSTLRAGLAMIPGMAAGAVAFIVAPKLASRFRPANVIAGGLVVAAAALLVMTQVGATSGTTIVIVVFAAMSLFGVPVAALGNNLVVGSAPPEKAGSAGSMAQMANELGGTLGFALLGTIGTAVYRGRIAGTVPSEVPAEAAAAARDSLPGASAAAADLPERLGGALLDPAHAAFLSGVHVVAVVGAVLVVGVAALVAYRLRHLPPIGQAEQGAGTTDEPEPLAVPAAAHGAAGAGDA